MHTPLRSDRRPSFRFFRGAFALATLSVLSSPLCAQNTPGGDDRRRRGGEGGGERGSFNPQDMQARMLSALRERFEVTDDEEWKVISDRLNKVLEVRRNTMSSGIGGAMMFGRGGTPGGSTGGDSGRSSRGGTRTSGTTEVAALGAAVRDKLPDAEIKSRLDRVRELRKDNEAKLAKAQEELRAVLSVRQEAIAVVAGLLP